MYDQISLLPSVQIKHSGPRTCAHALHPRILFILLVVITNEIKGSFPFRERTIISIIQERPPCSYQLRSWLIEGSSSFEVSCVNGAPSLTVPGHRLQGRRKSTTQKKTSQDITCWGFGQFRFACYALPSEAEAFFRLHCTMATGTARYCAKMRSSFINLFRFWLIPHCIFFQWQWIERIQIWANKVSKSPECWPHWRLPCRRCGLCRMWSGCRWQVRLLSECWGVKNRPIFFCRAVLLYTNMFFGTLSHCTDMLLILSLQLVHVVVRYTLVQCSSVCSRMNEEWS